MNHSWREGRSDLGDATDNCASNYDFLTADHDLLLERAGLGSEALEAIQELLNDCFAASKLLHEGTEVVPRREDVVELRRRGRVIKRRLIGRCKPVFCG